MKKWYLRFMMRQIIKFIRKNFKDSITERFYYGKSEWYEWTWTKEIEDDLFNRKKTK